MDWDGTRPEASLTSYLRSPSQLVPNQKAAQTEMELRRAN